MSTKQNKTKQHLALTVPTIQVAAALLMVSCKGTPDPIEECPAMTDGTGGCVENDPPEPPPECADPEFDTSPPPATEFQCEGQAGGHIVFEQVPVMLGQTVLGGGPGSIPSAPEESPEWIPFPSMEHEVSACCYGMQTSMGLTDSCRSDCARAAVNDILERLRTAAMAMDPSDGKCDQAPMGFGGPSACRDNLRNSLESFIEQIECNYEQVVEVVSGNEDPDLPYWDFEFPFLDSNKFTFQDPDCSHDQLGCLFNAELRAFCEISDHTEQSSCEQAGNLPDPAAGDEACGLDETGEGLVSGNPFGVISQLVYCSPQTECAILSDLHYNVGYNFHVFWDEGVEMTFVTLPTRGYQLSGLDTNEHSKELLDAFGIQNGDVITHVNSTQLVDEAATLDVIGMLDEDDGPWSITVRRWNGSSWSTLSYSVEIATSFDSLARGEQDPSKVAAPGADEQESGPMGSCACQASRRPAPWGFTMLLLGGAFMRRRR